MIHEQVFIRLYLCYIISLFHYVFPSVICIFQNTIIQFTIIVLKHKHYFNINKKKYKIQMNGRKIQVQKNIYIMGADELTVREKEYNNNKYIVNSYGFTHFLKRTPRALNE